MRNKLKKEKKAQDPHASFPITPTPAANDLRKVFTDNFAVGAQWDGFSGLTKEYIHIYYRRSSSVSKKGPTD